jgi:antitoxin component of MazEF toxin-antitoxin module
MLKSVIKVGNSHGIIFDAAIMDMAHLKVGDQMNVTVHDGGSITLTPVREQPSHEEISQVISTTMENYQGTMRHLA